MIVDRWIWAGLSGIVVFFAAWTLWSILGVALHQGIKTVELGLLPCLLIGLAAAFGQIRHGTEDQNPQQDWAAISKPSLGLGLIATLLFACFPFAGSALHLLWIVALLPISALIILRFNPQTILYPAPQTNPWDGKILIIAACAAITITVLSNRPQPEDYRYLWMIVRLLHHPDLPIFDLVTVKSGPQEIFAWHPREILFAALQRHTGLSLLDLYYEITPPIHAVIMVGILFLSARQFVDQDAGIVVLICIAILTAWGQAHATFGNFSFARMFHGQAVLASWAGPAAYLFGLQFGRKRTGGPFILLVASVICAFGQWHTGAVIGPLAALIGTLSAWPNRTKLQAPILALICLGLLGAFIWSASQIAPSHIKLWELTEQASESFAKVFPADLRSVIALALVALTGIIVKGQASRLASRTLFFGLVFAVNPFGMETLSRIIPSLSFRVLWAFPVVLFMGISIVTLARLESKRWHWPLLTTGILVLFLCNGRWITSSENGNDFGNAGYKIYPKLREWIESDVDTPPSLVGSPFYVPTWPR